MNVHERPIVFECAGCELIGMLHLPENVRSRGLITVVAGGPQYRAGVGRQLIQMARELAAQGTPVLRFDHRGLGDSEGRFRGFEDIEDDIRAALSAFREHAPQVKEFVLCGGCDAASAIMINAWKYPEVTGIILGNPWVHDEFTSDTVAIRHHYTKRIFEKDLWLKVITLHYNPLPALAVIGRTAVRKIIGAISVRNSTYENNKGDDPKQHFIERMRNGLVRYSGDLMLIMSGRSLYSKEFDELVNNDRRWQEALRKPRSVMRQEIPEADQTFSSATSRQRLFTLCTNWLCSH